MASAFPLLPSSLSAPGCRPAVISQEWFLDVRGVLRREGCTCILR